MNSTGVTWYTAFPGKITSFLVGDGNLFTKLCTFVGLVVDRLLGTLIGALVNLCLNRNHETGKELTNRHH